MWNSTSIDYVIGLILLLQGNNVIRVAVDQLFLIHLVFANSRCMEYQKIDPNNYIFDV